MVSEFKRKKYLHLYKSFFDVDESGSVNKNDFELCIEKIASRRGWNPDDKQYRTLQETVMAIWDGLQKDGDKDNDGEVSTEEWVELWDKYSKDPKAAADWQKLYCKMFFKLEDVSGDGEIDVQEFSSLYESFGLCKTESAKCFLKMAGDKKVVNWEDFQKLWEEFFVTENPEKPGNFIFGCYICSGSHDHSHSH